MMCQTLGIARSSYYQSQHKTDSKRSRENCHLSSALSKTVKDFILLEKQFLDTNLAPASNRKMKDTNNKIKLIKRHDFNY